MCIRDRNSGLPPLGKFRVYSSETTLHYYLCYRCGQSTYIFLSIRCGCEGGKKEEGERNGRMTRETKAGKQKFIRSGAKVICEDVEGGKDIKLRSDELSSSILSKSERI